MIQRLTDEIMHYRRTHDYISGDTPQAEISMHPADYCELMDTPDVQRYIDVLSRERNFRGHPIVFDGEINRPVVRDRTSPIER